MIIIAATIVALIAIAVVLRTYYAIYGSEPEPDPFHTTLVVTGSEHNATDANLTDLIVWVAVAAGEPVPRWEIVEVTLAGTMGTTTLSPPRLQLEVQDGDGRISEGDLIRLNALDDVQTGGELTLMWKGKAIGTVELHHGTT